MSLKKCYICGRTEEEFQHYIKKNSYPDDVEEYNDIIYSEAFLVVKETIQINDEYKTKFYLCEICKTITKSK